MLEVLADPGRQREIVPTFDLKRLLGAAAHSVNGPAEANAGSVDLALGRCSPSRAAS